MTRVIKLSLINGKGKLRDRVLSCIWEYIVRARACNTRLPESGDGRVVDFCGSVLQLRFQNKEGHFSADKHFKNNLQFCDCEVTSRNHSPPLRVAYLKNKTLC